MFDRLTRILEEIDFVLAERRELAAEGPRFCIVHQTRGAWLGAHELRVGCLPGEELSGVLLLYEERELQLRLSPAEAALFNFLAWRRVAQTASQIERSMQSDPFCAGQRLRARSSNRRSAQFHRTSIKTYAQRIKAALALAFAEAGLPLDPAKVMITQRTVGNEVTYAIRARVEWRHAAG